jgi:hypothetical protein
MAHKHNPQDGFPILNAKPAGVPCEHLEIGQNVRNRLYGCNIYPTLEDKGWTTCTRFSCHGAGQAVTGFFKELGVSWSQKQEELNDNQWRIRILNFRYGYQALHYVFQRMSSMRNELGEEEYEKVRESVALASKDFCAAMERTDQDLDPNYWAKVHFSRAIRNALLTAQAEIQPEPQKAEAVSEEQGWFRTAISGIVSFPQRFRNKK